MAWNSTTAPQLANAGYVQQGGDPAASVPVPNPIPAPPTVLWAPRPVVPIHGLDLSLPVANPPAPPAVLWAPRPIVPTRGLTLGPYAVPPISLARGSTPGPLTALQHSLAAPQVLPVPQGMTAAKPSRKASAGTWPKESAGTRSKASAGKWPYRRKIRICNFVDANGHYCGKKLTRPIHRRLITCHAFKELKQIECERLTMQHAKIITSDQKKDLIKGYQLMCLVCKRHKESQKERATSDEAISEEIATYTYSRSDHLRRHLRKTCVVKPSSDEIDRIVKEAVGKQCGWRDMVQRLDVKGLAGLL